MGNRIVISESQYSRLFLNEQWPRGGTNSQSNTPNVSEQTAKFYRLWSNSTPVLSKKYGKGSEFDLDSIKTRSNSGTFNKSYSQGKTQFDKDWLIVPNRYKLSNGATDGGKSLYFTKGGEIIYRVNTKTSLPEKLSPKSLIYQHYGNGREEYVDLDEDTWYDGREIYKEVSNIYSSQKTKLATSVIEQEKKESKDEIDEEIKNVKSNMKGRGVPSNLIGGSLSGNHVYAQTSLNIIRQLNTLISNKVITGTKGKYGVCIKGIGTCNIAAGGGYYVANNFSELADNISNKMINTNKSPYVVVNNTIYFDFGKVQKNLDDAFSRDKYVTSSDLFPDGWWNFYVKYFGTDNYQSVINSIRSISTYDIDKNKETLNVYDKKYSIFSGIGDCFQDYHCVLDVLSIAALAVPGVGLALSAGFDFVNGLSFGVEAYNAENSEDRYAAILAGGLTMFGGLVGGGIRQTNKIVKYGAKNPKVYEYASDVLTTVKKEFKGVKSLKSVKDKKRLEDLYEKLGKKHNLTKSEQKLGNDLLHQFSKIDPADAKQYTKALSELESKIQRGNLVSLGKHKGLKTAIDSSGGDVVVGLKKYMGKVARKEAVMEASLFVIVTEAMEQPSVQKWIADKYTMLKYSGRKDIRGMVEKEGYGWDATKNYFGGVTTGSVDYSKEQSEKDNTLLKKAWEDGWRPWPKGVMEPTEKHREESMSWLIQHPKYQTDGFKEIFTPNREIDKRVKPENPDDEESGVEYYDNEESIEFSRNLDLKYRNNDQPEGEISFDF